MYTRGLGGRNVTAMELALVVAIAGILMALFLRRMERVEALMERTAVQLVVQDLQSRTLMARAGLAPGAERDDPSAWVGRNPVGRVIPSLGGYVGEQERVDWTTVAPGEWVFERSSGTLQYRVLHEDRVEAGVREGPARLAWRLAPRYADQDGDGRFTAGADRFDGLMLEAVGTPRWRLE